MTSIACYTNTQVTFLKNGSTVKSLLCYYAWWTT